MRGARREERERRGGEGRREEWEEKGASLCLKLQPYQYVESRRAPESSTAELPRNAISVAVVE
jgi:hypothetical protein